MPDVKKNFSLHIDREILEKSKQIAKYFCQSTNQYIQVLLRHAIEAFEEEHGKIEQRE